MLAVILAGGMSRRLGGVPKAGLMLDGQTLLARTVDAAAQLCDAGSVGSAATSTTADGGEAVEARIAVVGPVELLGEWVATAQARHDIIVVQEDPPFSGPASGIAAGLAALGADAGHVLVLACDMPAAGQLVQCLAAQLPGGVPGTGVMAVDGGRNQPLAAIYPVAELLAAVEEARAAHRLENASVFSLVANVNMKDCAVPTGLTADIDTWADARAQGIAAGSAGAEGRQLENQDEVLQAWTQKLLEAFEIGDIDVDVHAVLNVAGVAAHSIVRPAAPLTTFIAGLAAGIAAGAGQAPEAVTMKAALGMAKKLAAAEAASAPAAAEAPAAPVAPASAGEAPADSAPAGN